MSDLSNFFNLVDDDVNADSTDSIASSGSGMAGVVSDVNSSR